MFCKNCGIEIEENAKFCSACGSEIHSSTQTQEQSTEENGILTSEEKNVLDTLYQKEQVSLWIWIGVVCFQVLVGLAMPTTLAMAAWNGYACYQTHLYLQQMKQNPVGIFKRYDEALTNDIIFLVLNLVIGGVIGAVGAGYDLYVRQYAVEHKDILLQIENKYTGGENHG